MISPEDYEKIIEEYDFERLMREYHDLQRSIALFDKNKISKEELNIDPAPDVVNGMEKMYMEVIRERLTDNEYMATLKQNELREVMVDFIDRTIKKVWLKNVVDDYSDRFLLREDALKCSFYYHLRRKLSVLMKQYNLRIYPELYIKKLQYRADLAIVKIDPDKDKKDFRDCVVDYLAIMELKFVSGKSKNTVEAVKRDVTKMREYYGKHPETQYYCVLIYEEEMPELKLVDKRSTNNWANGNLSILQAKIQNGYEWFEVENFNHMNEDLKE